MKRTVWRFKLNPRVRVHAVEMPAGAQVTSVLFQADKIELWALVDPEAREEVRHFAIVPTGVAVDVPEGRHVHMMGMYPGERNMLHLMELVAGTDHCSNEGGLQA